MSKVGRLHPAVYKGVQTPPPTIAHLSTVSIGFTCIRLPFHSAPQFTQTFTCHLHHCRHPTVSVVHAPTTTVPDSRLPGYLCLLIPPCEGISETPPLLAPMPLQAGPGRPECLLCVGTVSGSVPEPSPLEASGRQGLPRG